MDKLLTIAIPAYNRTDLLEKIIISLKDESVSFNLLIVDDASPDDPTPMIKKHQKDMPNIFYHRNDKNLGYSGNVLKCYELAETKYVWFFCNDDTILPGAVSDVIEKIKKYKPTAMALSTKWVDSYGRLGVTGPSEDILYESMDEITDYQALMRMTFVSIVVFEKRFPMTEILKTNYTNNVFVQLTMALTLLSDNCRYVEGSNKVPAVFRHVGFKYGEFFKFRFIDEMRAIHAIKHNFDNRRFVKWSKSHAFRAFQLYMSRKLGLFSYTSPPTKQTIKDLYKYFGLFSIVILSFIPIYYLIPKFIMKFIYKLSLVIIHGNKKGIQVYKDNLNRAYRDKRDTDFVNYK